MCNVTLQEPFGSHLVVVVIEHLCLIHIAVLERHTTPGALIQVYGSYCIYICLQPDIDAYRGFFLWDTI